MKNQDEDINTSGWDAITAAFDAIYKGQEPRHYGTLVKFCMGGQDPLDGISAYRSEAGRPHWHIVSYGMSELYAKESENNEYSGWGFEFTFRLARTAKEQDPPSWALSFLQNLARYVYRSGNLLQSGHYMDLNGPIALETETEIRAVFFAEDPQLAELSTPNGKVSFLQVVGVTLDELAAARAWNVPGMLQVMENQIPLLITDLERKSTLTAQVVAAEVDRRTAIDGSSTGLLFGEHVRFTESGKAATISIGARLVEDFRTLLRGRIAKGRDLIVASKQLKVTFEPAERLSWRREDEGAVVQLPADAATLLASSLRVKKGVYPISDGLTFEVVPSQIKDHKGNVVQVLGE